MNTLPKNYNRWLVLLGLLVISLLVTFFVIRNKTTQKSTMPVSRAPVVQPNVASALPTTSQSVKIRLAFDYTAGFVDVFISNPNMVEHGEIVFKLASDVRFSKIEEDNLFEKYLTSSETDKVSNQKSLRIGATKGIEGNPVQPGNDQKFARVYFSNLKPDSVIIDEVNSSFFVASGNPTYKVEWEK